MFFDHPLFLSPGSHVWYGSWIAGEGPGLWNVEITKFYSFEASFGKIITFNGVAPTPCSEEQKALNPDCEIHYFTSRPYWTEAEAMKALKDEVHRMIGQLDLEKTLIGWRWFRFIEAREKDHGRRA